MSMLNFFENGIVFFVFSPNLGGIEYFLQHFF